MGDGKTPDGGVQFEFATATRIRFGRGVLAEVAPAVAGMGRRVFLITGRSADRSRPLAEAWRNAAARLQPTGSPASPPLTPSDQPWTRPGTINRMW